jgi:hypothetical protein
MVQIHSPRPFFYNQLTRIRIVNERLVVGQEVNRSSVFAPTILSPLIAIRYAAFFNWDSHFIFADNTDKICGFV